MLLRHALALSPRFVLKGDGSQVPKTGPFVDADFKAEDWQPVQTVPDDMLAPIPPPADCGCGPDVAKKK